MTSLLFSTFEVSTQAFYRSSLSYAIVNLKPVVTGHVLVVPKRPVPRLADLDDNELSCLMRSVKRVGKVIETAYKADSLTIVCQDGKAAGQTVPHVHFHIMPRMLEGDPFQYNNDEIYTAVDKGEALMNADLQRPREQQSNLHVDSDERRGGRSMQDMEKEAAWLKSFFNETSPN